MKELHDLKDCLNLNTFEKVYKTLKYFSGSNEKKMFLSLIKSLDSEQIEALLETKTPLIVSGRAGSGKTEILIKKIIYCLFKEKKPGGIMYLTFSSFAAREIKLRIYNFLNTLSENPELKGFCEPVLTYFSSLLCGTFHSICYKILNDKVFDAKNCEILGFRQNFTIINKQDAIKIIKKIAGEEDAEFLNKCFNNFTQSLYTSDFIRKKSVTLNIKQLYIKFMEEKTDQSCMDFNDLIYYTAMLLRKNPGIKEYYNSKINYMFIDDYQDADFCHYVVFRLLTGEKTHITVAGDEYQKIFYFKNADVNSFELFKKDFNERKNIALNKNYRCGGKTLNIMKKTFSFKTNETGGFNPDIFYKKIKYDKDEGFFIASKIKELEKTFDLNKICVGVRNSFQAADIYFEMRKFKIPVLNSAMRSKTTPEASYFITLLSLICQLVYSAQTPKWKFPKEKIKRLMLDLFTLNKFKFCAEDEIILKNYRDLPLSFFYDGEFNGIFSKLTKSGRKLFHSFIYGILNIINLFYTAPPLKITDKIILFLELSGGFTPEKADAIALIKLHIKHYSLIYKGLDNLAFFEKYIFDIKEGSKNSLFSAENPGVRLATFHSLKGQEFDCLFITGFEEGIFPALKFFTFPARKYKLNFIEFEKKLFYTVVSRAKRTVYFTSVKKRETPRGLLKLSPSRFLKYVKKDAVFL